jgi:sugar fermentation stimulation protein A
MNTLTGSYLLLMKLNQAREVRIGKLGHLKFKPGYYVYVGNAMGGLEQRITRHFRREKKLRWHIDYLTAIADKILAIAIPSKNKLECKIARKLEIFEGIESFGCSDCKCKTHLFYFRNPEEVFYVLERLIYFTAKL